MIFFNPFVIAFLVVLSLAVASIKMLYEYERAVVFF